VIERGVDTDRFAPRCSDPGFWPRHGLRGEHTLLYVGRLSREKNLGFLAEVARALHQRGRVPFELAIVGEGPYEAVLRGSLAELPVAFTGVLQGDALATAFASSSLLVFPSTTDTFGNVVLESLACGTPACVSDVGGPAEIVHHRETGLVLPAGELTRWCEAIESLLLDAPGRARMAGNGCAYAQTHGFAGVREQQWARYAHHIDRHRASLQHDLR
jgi:glycosyltransferase involved in cell wall biosynthesis